MREWKGGKDVVEGDLSLFDGICPPSAVWTLFLLANHKIFQVKIG